jgi:hypothetical protein
MRYLNKVTKFSRNLRHFNGIIVVKILKKSNKKKRKVRVCVPNFLVNDADKPSQKKLSISKPWQLNLMIKVQLILAI